MAILNYFPGGGGGGLSSDQNYILFNPFSGLTDSLYPNCFLSSYWSFITDIKLSNVKYVNPLTSLSNLKTVRITGVGETTMYDSTFTYLNKLEYVEFPDYSGAIPTWAFGRCFALSSISFPKACAVDSYAFNQCHNLKEINLPMFSRYVASFGFASCSNLSKITLGGSATSNYFKYIGGNAFQRCFALMQLHLKMSEVFALSGANQFYSTPITDSTYTGSFGSIYVPASLLASYKTATNWTQYSSRMVGV